jgi:hypothetical protein
MSIPKQVLKDATKKCKSYPVVIHLSLTSWHHFKFGFESRVLSRSWNVHGRHLERAGAMGSSESRRHTAAVPGGFAAAVWEPAIAVIYAASRVESSLLW